jgi:hypothetical protein
MEHISNPPCMQTRASIEVLNILLAFTEGIAITSETTMQINLALHQASSEGLKLPSIYGPLPIPNHYVL